MKVSAKDNIVRDFASKQGSYYQSNYGDASPRTFIRRLRRQMILECVGDAAMGADVLDAGCGPALLFPEILERCRSYTALDLTPSNLESITAAIKDPRFTCVIGDMDTFSWGCKPVDVIICSGALEYVDMPERTLGRMVDSLREGGLLVCSLPNAHSPYRLWSEWVYAPVARLLKRMRGNAPPHYPRRLFCASTVKAQAERSARHVDVRFFGQRALLQPLDVLLPEWDVKAARCLAASGGLWPKLLATEFLLAVRR